MKIFHWIGAILLGLTGLYFATSKRSAVQKVEHLQEERIRVLDEDKSNSLRKASSLNTQIKKQQAKAKKAGERSDARIAELESRDKTSSLAVRVKDFNKSLGD